MKLSMPLKMAVRGYQEAVTALNSLQSNYANIMAIRESGDRKNQMNIWEMQEWSRRIGYNVSEFDKLNVVHITGTKGKGSTAAFVASILGKYKVPKVGLYTSPHLKSVTERIRINGNPISEDKFAKYFFEVWDKLENTESELSKFPHMIPGSKPGYFKYLTLLSFHVFMREGCDCCVYEVGVGGEFDSTNIVERPLACGVTQLGIDHTFMLGNTIEEIAWNKGGIFKKQAPAFTVKEQPPKGLKMLEQRANERGTQLEEVPIYQGLRGRKLGIAGDFQIANASLAVALSSQALASMYFLPSPIPNTEDASIPARFLEGLELTRWDGRCQTLVKGSATWFIDGAHTKESIEAASGWFTQQVVRSKNKKILLFNQQSRDANSLLSNLYSKTHPDVQFDQVIFTTNVTWTSGSYSSDLVSMNTSKEQVDNLEVQKSLAEKWTALDGQRSKIHVTSSIEAAYTLIRQLEEPVDVFVTGSLHLVGGLLVVFDNL
ncbi:hypothetical protein ZYGR_0S02100 [Zygosaccharomyces rouxii]|uniref:Folylpolyglutamate synthase n=2 Tax=Zygosaccharomyces rouxii TaxID=4956 RepID=C5DXR5_ZYGRC|nr:uncharacterized protein ZYRO0F07216g [Zygosaccharomyces rouxii]KAH9199336.1 Mur ligase [Zygosaccharomyces rouxii]GAV50076.1 hypothetical protein ZYGR_0S02100 [Zygosaccharomyces rouxii]CAR28576.1 ZYRO0F07216p [Zygosaccharomyces rouxii]